MTPAPSAEKETAGGDRSVLERVVEFVEPGPESASPELRLRLQVTLALIGVAVMASVGAALWLAVEGRYSRAAAMVGFAGLFGLEIPILRATGSRSIVAHLQASLLMVALGSLVYASGGQTTPPLLLASLIPVTAALIDGLRSGVFWLVATLVALVGAYAAVLAGLRSDAPLDEAFVLRGTLMSAALVAVILLLLVALYERIRRDQLDELRDAGDALERARREQLEMRDRFVSHVAHELRTPLSSLHMAVAGLADSGPAGFDAEQRDYLDIAERNATQLGRMIADLTEMMRAETGKLLIERAAICPVECVEEAVREQRAAAARREVSLRGDWGGGIPSVLADPTRVRQVLNNLIENAVKFSPRGGEVVVRLENEPTDHDFVRLSVCDRGTGIAEGHLEKIFGATHQVGPAVVGPGGLGLGLAICRELVARHGGRIWAESRLGAGSTFHFTLPRAHR